MLHNHRRPIRSSQRALWSAAIAGLVAGLFWQARATQQDAPPSAPPAVASPHGELKVACEQCHTATSWTVVRSPSLFDHGTTGFPLQGRHRDAECRECHASLEFHRVATSCADCHRDVHESRYGARCQDCHGQQSWVGRADAVRQHAAVGFPLRGVHSLLECTRCHATPGEASVAKLSNDCVSCHADDYAATQAPNHGAAGYPTRCDECHDAARATWTGAGFDHATTGFALAGAHRTLECTRCHASGTGFGGLSATCVVCHRDDYDATANPNHVAADFGTDCAGCHSSNAWRPATFDHDRFFRINSGRHAGLWPNCAICHPSPSSYAEFTCLQCHEHNQTETGDKHREVSGYRYESAACYECHRGV